MNFVSRDNGAPSESTMYILCLLQVQSQAKPLDSSKHTHVQSFRLSNVKCKNMFTIATKQIKIRRIEINEQGEDCKKDFLVSLYKCTNVKGASCDCRQMHPAVKIKSFILQHQNGLPPFGQETNQKMICNKMPERTRN